MANVCLAGAEPAGITAAAVDLGDRFDLNGVTQRCPCPVGLDQRNLGCIEVSVPEGSMHYGRLRPTVGSRQPRGAAILIDRGALDDGMDVAVGHRRIVQSLQYDDHAPLTAPEAVGRGVEGMAHAVRREHPEGIEGLTSVRCQHQVDADNHREIRLASAQSLNRQVGCGQRR